MKIPVLLILCVLIGTVVSFIYLKVTSPQANKDLISPKINSSKFSLEKAPTESLRANVSSMSGKTKWQSRIATEPGELTTPVSLQQGEKVVTGDDGNISFEFSQTTKIALLPKTELELIQTLPKAIVFKQNKGQAEYQKIDSNPLSVRSFHLLIKQNDGDMVVSIDDKKPLININVLKGSITLAFNDLQNQSNVVSVNQGQEYIFNDETREGKTQLSNSPGV